MTIVMCPEYSINLSNDECPSCHRKLLHPPSYKAWTKEDIDQWWEEEMRKLENKK
ncbi:MAG: hypothetical protein WCF23_16590 [Candidatus Nitrosopolaris sp.]